MCVGSDRARASFKLEGHRAQKVIARPDKDPLVKESEGAIIKSNMLPLAVLTAKVRRM